MLKNLQIYIKNTSLWGRIFVFFILFVVISGSLGPMIINPGLVGKYGFEIYGGLGKALIFSIIAFGLLFWRSQKKLKFARWSKLNLIWLAPAVMGYIIAVISIKHLRIGDNWIGWPVFTHFGIVIAIISSAVLALSWSGIKEICSSYGRELYLSLGVGLAYYVFLTLVYRLWSVFATTVMHATGWLLTLSGLEVNILPPRYLILDKFSIEISQWCSGIESIALFAGMYAVIGIIDRNRIDFRKYVVILLPALIAIFCFNILRVYLLIMAGYYINERIAFTLFHTYAGMIFFIIFTGLFWKLSYHWMLKERVVGVEETRS